MSEVSNQERAAWAARALAAFCAETGQHPANDREDAVADLLTNLEHYCRAEGLDFAALAARGRAVFQQEDPSEFAWLVGERIRDNDPRMNYERVLTVRRILDAKRIEAEDGHGRIYPIQIARIHSDGKARRSGFSVLREA